MKKGLFVGAGLVMVVATGQARADDVTPADRARTAVDAALKRDVAAVSFTARATGPSLPALAAADEKPIERTSGGLGATGGDTAARATVGAGSFRAPPAPKAAESSARVGRPQRTHKATSATVDAQRQIVTSMNEAFVGCFSEADASVAGTTVLNALLAPTGEVSKVVMVAPGGISPKAATCLGDVLGRAKFGVVERSSVVQVRVVPRDLHEQVLASRAVLARK